MARKNLLQPETKQELIERIHRLTPNAERKWGKMNVNQMLRHTSEGLSMAYGDVKSESRGNIFSRALMRYIILNTDMATPQGKANTFPEINMVERNIYPENFEEEKEKLVQMIRCFPERTTHDKSPLLGKMTTENWARLNYTHMHHHFSQFGV